MKYNVGDKVKLKSKAGLDELKQQHENLYIPPVIYEKAGSVCTINRIYDGFYSFEEMPTFWAESFIEGLVEDTEERLLESAADACKKVDEMMEARYQKEKTYYDGEQWSTEFECPEGYIFKDENGNVIEAKKIVLEKKKKEYPKSYEECAKVLLDRASVRNDFGYKGELLVALQKLLVCRDAYWKIAGEEMGLGKPWEPDYDSEVDKFGIVCYDGQVTKTSPVQRWERHLNKVFDFPTKEMRDAFKENFDPDIEICKKLL